MSEPKLDFLIIGAQKAATTSLHEYARTHPMLHLPPSKENPFFSEEETYARGWREYQAWVFGRAPRDRLWGTASPQYMAGAPMGSLPGGELREGAPELIIPRRIAAEFPSVRLVAVLRDPISRAISQHRMNAMRGIEARPLAVGLDDELRPANLELARQAPTETNSYVVRGEYGRILGGYLSFFPRDSLFLTSTAALVLAPGDVLRELWRFLGVDESHVPINLDVRYRRSADRRRVPGVDLRRLRDHVRGWRAFRAIWYRLPFDFRAHVSQAYWHLALRVDLWNRTSGDVGSPTLQPDLVERLIRHYEPDMLKLEKLVGHVTGLALGAPRSGGLTELEGAGSAAA